MTKRVVITGAAGFLGSHLTDRFLADGYEVVGVDNFITGTRANLAHLENESRFDLITHDVSRPLYFHGKIEGVLHFASPASPVDYLEMPIQTLKVGSLGSHNMLGLAKAKGARFFLASTSEVYGDPQVHPQPEDYWGNVNPVGPRGVYDEAKRFAEAITTAYHRTHGVETRIARIFNTYGPRMRTDDGRVVRSADLTTWETLVTTDLEFITISFWPEKNWIIVADRGAGRVVLASASGTAATKIANDT